MQSEYQTILSIPLLENIGFQLNSWNGAYAPKYSHNRSLRFLRHWQSNSKPSDSILWLLLFIGYQAYAPGQSRAVSAAHKGLVWLICTLFVNMAAIMNKPIKWYNLIRPTFICPRSIQVLIPSYRSFKTHELSFSKPLSWWSIVSFFALPRCP